MPSPVNSFSGLGAPAPAPSNVLARDTQPSIHEVALSLHAKRLQLIASNMANADTPNYKAVDIDFRETLRQTLQSQASKTPGSHAAAGRTPAVNRVMADQPFALQYRSAVQRSVDSNTVDMDVERASFADATVRYQFALDRVSGHYKEMAQLLADIK